MATSLLGNSSLAFRDSSQQSIVHFAPTSSGEAGSKTATLTLSQTLNSGTTDSVFLAGLKQGTASDHAVNKEQLDAQLAGLQWKKSVRGMLSTNFACDAVVTAAGTQLKAKTAPVNGSEKYGPFSGGGVTGWEVGDRVLLTAQSDSAAIDTVSDPTNHSRNGIYRILQKGVAAGAGQQQAILIRDTDANDGNEMRGGTAVFVREGTYADQGWVCTTDGTVNLDALSPTALQFTQFSSQNLTAGNGILKTGSTLSVKANGSTIAVGTDGIKVAANGISNTEIAANTITKTEIQGNTITKDEIAPGTITGGELNSSVAGDGLSLSGSALAVSVDDSTIETNSDSIRVKAAGIGVSHLAAAVAGDGLSGGAGSALAVSVDDSTIETNSDSIRVKAAGIGVSHLAAAVAGDGLSGGAGSALAVSVDDSTIETDSDSIRVKALGITASHLAAAVAGDGLSGGAGSALAVSVDDSTIETDSDSIRVKASGINTNELAAKCVTSAKMDTNIAVEGTMQAVSFQATSDRRKKENIASVNTSECLATCCKATPVRYNFKEGAEKNRTRIGFIAQDCELWCRESVVDDADGFKSISYCDWVPLLAGAVQAMNNQVAELKQQLHELEAVVGVKVD